MTAPLLGKPVRHEWPLDWHFLSVNHGSYGATPRVVLAAQQDWRRRMESQTGRFFHCVLPDALRQAAGRLGAFLGADGKDIAFVDNATSGCNAVLRSLRLRPGEEVLSLTHGYGAVRNTIRFVTERAGARMTTVPIPFPDLEEAVLIANLQTALTPRTRLAVLDHVTSGSALVLPMQRMIAACHAAGVPVLVDGAHGPAQLDLDLRALNADWYAGNCHKWLCAPKGSAFLWAAPHRQQELHPTVISHGFGQGFLDEFDWTGTRDPSACLAVSTAIDFHTRLGGAALRARNIALAAEATAFIARRLNTRTGAGGAFGGAMGVVRLPVEPTQAHAAALRQRLMTAGTDAPVHVIADAVWMRISAFAYNDMADYERLADLVARALRA